MKKNFILLVLACLSGIIMPITAQIDSRFTGEWALGEAVVEEFLPRSGTVVSTATYTRENITVSNLVGEMIIVKMRIQPDGSGFISCFSGIAAENPDVRVTNDIFTFSVQGEPVRTGINEYHYQVLSNDEIRLTPQANVCTGEKCFRVVEFSLKRAF